MTTLLYLSLKAATKTSKVIIPKLENAIRNAGMKNHFIVSQQDDDTNIEHYIIYFEERQLLKRLDSSSFFELHVDQGNKVTFHVYGGIKTRFPVDDTDTEIRKLVEKMKEYI
ncbi:MAG: hypothetical protein Q8R37_01425 [Nanoarchaeota archaeon]|nr:hypothetical protein [Nanoarchaeota archaeon]